MPAVRPSLLIELEGVNSKPKLFGTDGVRGVAGEFPLDPLTVTKLGYALGAVLGQTVSGRPLRIVLGADTRQSSDWISQALGSALAATGAEVSSAGVITTPGVAFLTRHHGFDAGVVVSASHNPFEDNGIKVFSAAGSKQPETIELQVERLLEREDLAPAAETFGGAGRELQPDPSLRRHYIRHLASLISPGLGASDYRLVVDCANGAASAVIPDLVAELGIDARLLNTAPDGRNINLGCGSLHPEAMAAATRDGSADLGVAFDGDADRAIFATGDGQIADGDHVLWALAPYFKSQGLLRGDAVVGTLMTNLGLEIALACHGIAVKRTAVGDKYVLEEMLRSGLNLGGEPSGHIIFADISLAGDGILTLIEVLRLVAESGRPLGELLEGLTLYPQVIRNVQVREKQPLELIPEVNRAIDASRCEFGDHGRVVVRYSGTERLARVMVEAEDAEAAERHAARIAEAIGSALRA